MVNRTNTARHTDEYTGNEVAWGVALSTIFHVEKTRKVVGSPIQTQSHACHHASPPLVIILEAIIHVLIF